MNLEFDPHHDLFCDGTSLDWWITEPIETAWVTSEFFSDPIDSRHMRARVALEENTIEVPIARFASDRKSDRKSVDVRHVRTVRDFLRAIVDFYAQSIDEDWLKENRPDPPDTIDFYHQDVIAKTGSGQKATILELLGSAQTEGLVDNPTHRRHPLMCNGLVRYEGMRGNRLLLGS